MMVLAETENHSYVRNKQIMNKLSDETFITFGKDIRKVILQTLFLSLLSIIFSFWGLGIHHTGLFRHKIAIFILTGSARGDVVMTEMARTMGRP